MKTCALLLFFCAAAGAQSARADGQSTLDAIRAACSSDVHTLCAGVQPGGGRIVACLKEHKDSLSDGCKQAAGMPGNPSSSAASAAGAAPPTVAAPPVQAKPHPAPKADPAKKGSPDREKFKEFFIVDAEHRGMRAVTIHLPEKWRLESKVEWHYGWLEDPVEFSAHAENPDNAEGFFVYPLLRFDYVETPPQYRNYMPKTRPGERLWSGALSSPPRPAVQTLAHFIQKVRPNAVNLKWLGQQDLPDLAKALRLEPWPNQHGLAIKIGYDLDGQPVEEAFFGVYYLAHASYPGTLPGVKQTNWGLHGLQSFRAPAGTLEARMPIFCVMAKSYDVNPEWSRLAKAIAVKMQANFDQQMKQMDDATHAAQAMMAQTMREQAAFQANFDKQEAAFRSSGGVDDSNLRDGGVRSAADHWDDLIRGVDTLNDPNGGTTQLSNLGQYHFTDGFGNYRTTDDPNYTPEKAGEVGSWTPMTAAP